MGKATELAPALYLNPDVQRLPTTAFPHGNEMAKFLKEFAPPCGVEGKSSEFFGDRQHFLRWRRVTHEPHVESKWPHHVHRPAHGGVDPSAVIAESASAEKSQENHI